jgi:hypothetical protein
VVTSTGLSRERDYGSYYPWGATELTFEVSDGWRRGLSFSLSCTGTAGAIHIADVSHLLLPYVHTGTALNCVRRSEAHRSWRMNIILIERETELTASSNLRAPSLISSAEQVQRLHRESGLTWLQIAKLFQVSRRAVHGWAAGNRMNATNLEHLAAVLNALRALSVETPEERRQLLLAPAQDGPSVFDQLRLRAARGPAVEDILPVRETLGTGQSRQW